MTRAHPRLGWALAGLVLSLATTARAESPEPTTMPEKPSTTALATATFAGGCFWCMEPPFAELAGVHSVMPGYTGGTEEHPTYEQVSSGQTGHCEAIQITYDPSKVTYQQLLDVFWHNIDPTATNRQFVDVGKHYRTAIFYHDESQRQLAEASKAALVASGKFRDPIVTTIHPAGPFYVAEDYHREYYKKNPLRYTVYKIGSGRESYLKRTWGDQAPPKP
jgi:methionine-S-sulfoxide reductase